MRTALCLALAASLCGPALAADWPTERAALVTAAEQEGSLAVFALPSYQARLDATAAYVSQLLKEAK